VPLKAIDLAQVLDQLGELVEDLGEVVAAIAAEMVNPWKGARPSEERPSAV